MQVNVEAEVAAKALDDRDHARVQRRDRRQAVLLLHAAPHVLHHRPRQPPGDRGQQRRVVAQAHRHRLLRAPLSDGAAPPVPGPRWYKLPVLAASHPRLARQRAALSHGGGLAGD